MTKVRGSPPNPVFGIPMCSTGTAQRIGRARSAETAGALGTSAVPQPVVFVARASSDVSARSSRLRAHRGATKIAAAAQPPESILTGSSRELTPSLVIADVRWVPTVDLPIPK